MKLIETGTTASRKLSYVVNVHLEGTKAQYYIARFTRPQATEFVHTNKSLPALRKKIAEY